MSHICTSQKWVDSECVCMCACVWVRSCTWMCVKVSKFTQAEPRTFTSQDFSLAARITEKILYKFSATLYSLFQSTCLYIQITARQPTIASLLYYCQEETYPKVLIPSFHTSSFFIPAHKSKATKKTIVCTRKTAHFWCKLKSPQTGY